MKKINKDAPSQSPNALSEDELRVLRASVSSQKVDRSKLPHYDNSGKARALRYAKKNKTFVAVCAALIALCLIIVCLCVALAVKKAKENYVNKSDFTIILGDDKYTVEYKDAVRNDVLYVDMYKIAKYAELVRTGSSSNVKFTADEDNYLRFEDKAETAVINGNMVELGGVATVNEQVCEIPFEFLRKALSADGGLKVTLDTATNTVKIKRRMYITEKKDVYIPVEILFSADSFQVLQSLKRPDANMNYEYNINITDYLPSIAPEDKNAYLLLVNKQNPLSASYVPTDLVDLTCKTTRPMQLRRDAANALLALMRSMEAAGITDTYVTSAYRSYDYQVDLFEDYVAGHMGSGMTRDEAVAAALNYSASPGTSEHQSGLCVDFITEAMGGVLDERFENSAAFRWLQENAYKFGFILRFPSDKTELTGYKYESWHYRFVGRAAATEIYQSGLCLEEYLDLN